MGVMTFLPSQKGRVAVSCPAKKEGAPFILLAYFLATTASPSAHTPIPKLAT